MLLPLSWVGGASTSKSPLGKIEKGNSGARCLGDIMIRATTRPTGSESRASAASNDQPESGLSVDHAFSLPFHNVRSLCHLPLCCLHVGLNSLASCHRTRPVVRPSTGTLGCPEASPALGCPHKSSERLPRVAPCSCPSLSDLADRGPRWTPRNPQCFLPASGGHPS